VVIADRDELLLAAYRAFLAAEGFEAVAPGSDAACFDALRQGDAAAFVVDADLPRESGLEILAKLRAEAVSCPPVLLLASEPASIADTPMPVRDYALLLKPVSPATVAGVVRALADSASHRE
jgi:DNA-binding response OmpR family regulator